MPENAETIGIVYHQDYLLHTEGQHPERKERLEYIMKALSTEQTGSWTRLINPVPATEDIITLVHEPAYLRSLQEACRSGVRQLDMDTYIVPQSYDVALLAAGGAVTGLDALFGGGFRKVFALVRPPGHHAERNRAMGFCLLNNIAIAARAAQKRYSVERLAIIDWDVHHGNGTQHCFEEDPAVLFVSTHQSPAYPGTGRSSEVGRGKGEGYTVNIPLPAGCGDGEYIQLYRELIIPVLECYRPELLLISAGQDAYFEDPLAGMGLTGNGYYYMASALREVAESYAGGRILLCLEGGYHLAGQAAAVTQIIRGLRQPGPPPEFKIRPGLREAFKHCLQEVKEIQQRYWPLK